MGRSWTGNIDNLLISEKTPELVLNNVIAMQLPTLKCYEIL